MSRLLPLLALVLLVSGCGGPRDIRLKRLVTKAEVIGTWQLHPETLAWLSGTGRFTPMPGVICQIDFRTDGTCRYHSLLQYSNAYADCVGTWQLKESKDGRSTVDLTLNREAGKLGVDLDFTDIFKQVELYECWGDPDACDILRYDKIK